ncbi:MAG TPA: carboxypeptidase-like regulatory domain-containing protein [Enhygromyxa sp.]|nr:carboxypeptidase-like regulatory domain-containing protein [Enhygromyxa sp.]
MSRVVDSGLRWLAAIGVLAVIGVAVWSRAPERSRERAERRELERASTSRWASDRGGLERSLPNSNVAPIRGRILDPSAGPLTEGRVEVRCTGSGFLAAAAIDEEGRFEAPSCSEGPTCVRLIHPGVEQPRAWELNAGAAVELEAGPAPQLAGTIVGPDGEAVSGAELLVQHGTARMVITSDAAGEFAAAFPRVRPCDRCDLDPSNCRPEPSAPEHERARVLASASGLAPREIEVALDDEPVEIALASAAPPITGRVLGSNGEPFDRTRVLASNRARAYEQHATEVDAHGRFEFAHLAPAEYSLRAIRDERELATVTLARPGDEVELRSDLSARGSALTLEIVDADGQPIVGARIDGGPWRAAISDAEGRVEASAVLPGSYTVRVRAADCAPVREPITLEASASAWVRRVQLSADC